MPRRFSVHQFENGLTAVFELMPGTVSTAVGFLVKTGARDEKAKLDGVSHFLEHMMFKGTAKRGWQEINRDFDQMGARYNAFTSWEETCYYAWVLKDETPKALELISDMLASRLPEDEFKTEKKVILEEIARYRDIPEHLAMEEAMRIAFAGHRLCSNILGTEKTVGRLTREEMNEYFQRRYVPANIVLFACGDIDEEKVLSQIEQLWSTRSGARVENACSAPVFHPGARIVQKKDVAREHFIFLWPSVSLADPRSIAASLLGAVLGDDRNSRLYWALRHTGLAEEASGGYWGFSDTGLMTATASCDPSKAATVSKILRSELAKLKKGIKPEELQRAKNRARTSLVFSAETPFSRFRQLMHQWMTRRELLTAEEMLARIEAVTLKDLYALLEEYPLDADGVMVGLGPLKSLQAERKPAGKALSAKKIKVMRRPKKAASRIPRRGKILARQRK